MTFKHASIELGYRDLLTETLKSGRTYHTPDGKRYPSITTVLGHRNADWLHEWRARIGTEEANRISGRAARRGQTLHDMIEKYVGNRDPEVERRMPAIVSSFNGVKKVLDECVGKVYAQEAPLYSDHLMVAGRVDLVAEWSNRNAIIDFKTANHFKKREDIVNYYLQETAYAIMFEERTGIPIVGLVTVIMVDDRPEPLVYKEHRDTWAPELISAIEEYRRLKLFGRK